MKEIYPLLGHPKICSHGRSIPYGPCCSGGKNYVEGKIYSIYELDVGDGGLLRYIIMNIGVLTTRPWATGIMLLLLVIILPTIFHLVFQRRVWCRYLCPVSGFIGLYSMVSPLEVRVKDRNICLKHAGKECYRGSQAGYGCPWYEFPQNLNRNAYCGLCMECIKTCPLDNIINFYGDNYYVMDLRRTDVLVVGCGLAGLSAAIKARESGVDVILICKSPAGYRSCTYYSGGAFRVAYGNYPVERHFIETILYGSYLNDQELVKHLVSKAPTYISRLRDYGVNLLFRDGMAHIEGGYPAAGRSIVLPLLGYARGIGVKILDRVIALDLIRCEDQVCGAVIYDGRGDRVYQILSKSVVIATGGYGGLYSRCDNPSGTVGDGCILALRAGARLIDMEFIQFFPLGLAEEGRPIWIFPVVSGKLINRFGEEITEKYGLPPLNRSAVMHRDLLSRVIMREIRDGGGVDDALILDLSSMERFEVDLGSVLDKIGLSILRRLSIRAKRVKVAPLAHHTMGGIKIDVSCFTGVRGLYACGEVTGGIHGASRIGGNALTDAVVFGMTAGYEAAKYARSIPHDPKPDLHGVKAWKSRINLFKRGRRGYVNMRRRIGELMWDRCGILRSSRELRDLISEIRELKGELEELGAERPYEVMRSIETVNMVYLSEVISTAAMERRESRGSHFREDYPRADDKNWLKRVVIRFKNDGLTVEKEDIDMKYISLQ